MTLATDGNLYGTTLYSGPPNYGSLFRITTNGTFATVLNFDSTNGASPTAALTAGPDGSLYGSTVTGGSAGYGTLFKLSTNGAFTKLVDFNYANGAAPEAELTLASDGSFYGTTSDGGSGASGVIFRLRLPPTILSEPKSRTNLVGSTATFTVLTTGTQPIGYRWLRNGTNFIEGGNISGVNSNTLTLTDVQTGDASNFRVVVTNSSGSVTSALAVLTVRRPSSVALLRAGFPGPTTNTLTFTGEPNFQYWVQFATNLTTSPWFTLSTNTAAEDGTWISIDPAATNDQRFYRSASP